LGSAFLLYGGMLLTGLQVLRDAKITNGTYDLVSRLLGLLFTISK